nr:MAG TPA: hypothetical protein [Bacteriophage sp.]
MQKCKQASGKPDTTRNIPRKGYICRPVRMRVEAMHLTI